MITKTGLFFVVIAAFYIAAEAIGKNTALLVIYIIVTMAISYLLPIAAVIYKRQWIWLVIIPFATSLLFSIPSSLVANAGCHAGKEGAIWAVRAIPALWIGEAVAAPKGLTCHNF